MYQASMSGCEWPSWLPHFVKGRHDAPAQYMLMGRRTQMGSTRGMQAMGHNIPGCRKQGALVWRLKETAFFSMAVAIIA